MWEVVAVSSCPPVIPPIILLPPFVATEGLALDTVLRWLSVENNDLIGVGSSRLASTADVTSFGEEDTLPENSVVDFNASNEEDD